MNAVLKQQTADRTIREALSAWGWEDLIDGANEWMLDNFHVGPGFPRPVTDKGRVFVRCSGEVLFALPKPLDHFQGRNTLYVVLDDSEGESWDAQARDGVPAHERKPTHYRPSAHLRVVVAG